MSVHSYGPLPGTPRDLSTMEEHIARSERNSVKLYEYRDMELYHCDGKTIATNQTKLLDEIRQDLCAMRSCIQSMSRVLQSIADATPGECNLFDIQAQARKAVGVKKANAD